MQLVVVVLPEVAGAVVPQEVTGDAVVVEVIALAQMAVFSNTFRTG